MADQYKEQKINPGEELLTVGGDQITLPEGEPLTAVLQEISKIQVPGYKNPNTLSDRYVLRFLVTEQGEGQGQQYSKWVSPSMHPKSVLFDVVKSVYGKVEQGTKFDPTQIVGKPCRIILKTVTKDDMEYQSIDKVLGPKKDGSANPS